MEFTRNALVRALLCSLFSFQEGKAQWILVVVVLDLALQVLHDLCLCLTRAEGDTNDRMTKETNNIIH